MKKLFITLFFSFMAYAAMAANYYWVGGTGNWNDLTNWANSSGGPGNAYPQVPQSVDNVIFDANSFTANGQTVTINGTSTFCKNFDASAITQSGIIFSNNSVLNIYGDFLINNTIAYFDTGLTDTQFINFLAPDAAKISTVGMPFRGTGLKFVMPAAGKYTFLSSFYCSNTNFDIQLFSGTVDFGSWNINIKKLTAVGGSLNLNTSFVDCTTITIGTNVNLIGGLSNVVASDIGLNTEMNNTSSFYNLTISEYSPRASDWIITCSNSLSILKGMGITGRAGSKFTAPTIKLRAGYSYYLPETVYTDNFEVDGMSCLKPTGIYGRKTGTTINRTFGSWTGTVYNYVFLTQLKFVSGTPGSAVANNSVDGGGNTGITINTGTNTLYWRGGRIAAGNDNWNDPNNWSTTADGATPATCIPDLNTDVVFNANSFTIAGRKVKLNAQDNFCKNMTWVGTLNNPLLESVPPAGLTDTRLLINGSVTLEGMTTASNVNILLLGNGAQTIKTNAIPIKGLLAISASGGNYKLLDGLMVEKKFEINFGTFDTDGQFMNINAFHVYSGDGTTGPAAAVFLRNSVITIDYKTPPTAEIDGRIPLLFNHPTASCDFGTSAITINTPDPNKPEKYVVYLDKSNGALAFYNLIIGHTVTNIPEMALYNNNISFNKLTLRASLKLNYNTNTTIAIKTSLELLGRRTYIIEGGKTVDFGTTGNLDAVGNCGGFIKIQSSTSIPAIFTKSAGTITGIYLQLTNITGTGGGTFQADNAITIGNTSGWTVIPYASRNLYWVGNGGNWGDIMHWSLTSGGAGGECPPTSNDNVIFDANSFTLPGQIVSFDQNPDCHDFNALAITQNPTFKGSNGSTVFNLYGSLIFSNNMVWDFKETLNILGAGNNTLATQNKELAATVYFDASGSYKLEDDFTCLSPFSLLPSYFVIKKGGLDLNGKSLSAGYILNAIYTTTYINSNQTGPIDLKLKNSIINTNVWGFGIIAPSTFPITVDAGTSLIRVADTFTSSSGINYYDVEAISSSMSPEFFSANAQAFTIHNLIVQTKATISTELIITNDLDAKPGSTLKFNGTKTTFTKPGDIQLVGTGSQPITITSFTTGQQYSFIKTAGRICADFIYIRDNKASGGAIFTGGANANDQGGNQGWDFNPYPLPGTLSYNNAVSQSICKGSSGQLSVTFSTFAPQDFPKALELTITRGGISKDSVLTVNRNAANPAGPYIIDIGTTQTSTTVQIKKVISGGCFQKQTDLTPENLISRFSVANKPTAIVSIAGVQTTICSGSTITLPVTLSGTPPFNFTWTDGRNINHVVNHTDYNYNIVVNQDGNYALTALTDAQCDANRTDLGVPIVITVEDPRLVVTDPPIVVAPTTVDLTASSVTAGSTGINIFGYYADVNGTVPLNNPTAINESGTYYIRGLSSACQTDLTPVKVSIAQNYTPVIPNVFTPNGDGKNDVFHIGNLEVLLSASLKVYNRWGSLVFSSENYKNDWDGLKLTEGTYFYVLTCKSVAGEEKYSGWLMLKREPDFR